jgi:hypothetical protein
MLEKVNYQEEIESEVIFDRTRKSIGDIIASTNLFSNSPAKPKRPPSPPMNAETLSHLDRSVAFTEQTQTISPNPTKSSITITPILKTSTNVSLTKLNAEGANQDPELTSTSISPIKPDKGDDDDEEEYKSVNTSQNMIKIASRGISFNLSESQNNKSFSEKSHLAEEAEIAQVANNYDSENDPEFLDALNQKKTTRLSTIDINESGDSHRAEPSKPILRLSQCVFVAPTVIEPDDKMDEDFFVEYDDKEAIFNRSSRSDTQTISSKSPRKSKSPRRSVQEEDLALLNSENPSENNSVEMPSDIDANKSARLNLSSYYVSKSEPETETSSVEVKNESQYPVETINEAEQPKEQEQQIESELEHKQEPVLQATVNEPESVERVETNVEHDATRDEEIKLELSQEAENLEAKPEETQNQDQVETQVPQKDTFQQPEIKEEVVATEKVEVIPQTESESSSNRQEIVQLSVEADVVFSTQETVDSQLKEEIDDYNNSLNDTNNKTLDNNEVNNDESLNMSSISTNMNNESPLKAFVKNQQIGDGFLLPNEDANNDEIAPKMSRTNSELSLYSQISSVSEHYEKMKREKRSLKAKEATAEVSMCIEATLEPVENEEDEDNASSVVSAALEDEHEVRGSKRVSVSSIKRRAPVVARKPPIIRGAVRHMDDNELSVTKEAAAQIEASSKEATARGGGVALRRRRSDLSSISSSSATTTSMASSMTAKAAIAKVKASMEQLPPTLGKYK